MKPTKWELDSEKIQWDETLAEVVFKFQTIKACWKLTEKMNKSLHVEMVKRIYAPALLHLGHFVVSVKCDEDDLKKKLKRRGDGYENE